VETAPGYQWTEPLTEEEWPDITDDDLLPLDDVDL
jgi:hypothetical protein